MKSKYTRKQIIEAIQYWKKQLKAGNYVMESKPAVDVKKTVHEIMESIREAVSSRARIDESEDISVKIDDVEKAVSKDIKSPSDVKRFVEKNDEKVKEKIKDDSLLSKGWQLLKDILNAGMDGISWIIRHFDAVLAIVAVVSVYLFGLDRVLAFLGLGIGKLTQKTVEGAVETLADGFAAVTGPDYMAAGEKISNANAAAGGYGGWSGAGLGGGLREDEQSISADLQQLMNLASKMSPQTAKLAQAVKAMQDNGGEVNESSKAALFSLLGALMLAVGCTKECATKIETPLEQAAQIMQGTSKVKDLKEQLRILDAALEQIGDATSGIVGDTIEKWGTGKISKADTDVTLAKLGHTKKGIKAKKTQIAQQVFDQMMKED